MGLNRRTRVLLYVPLLQLGGAERQVGRLARGLDPSRFECIVAWSRFWGPVGDQLVEASIPVCHLPVDSPDTHEEAARLIREIQPDIFSSFSYSRNALDVLAADAAGVPLIITCRVNTREWDPEFAIQEWETVRNQRTHWVTAVSEAAANTCAKVEGVPREKITVVYNGVNIPERRGASPALRRELNLPESVTLVGCVANYRPEKGHELLLHAFRQVLDVHPETHLVCCGLDNRGLKAGLLELAAKLEIDKSVSLLDSRTDVDSVYRGLDVYVQPSLFEGFSNALLEAMARALPVVATGVGGNPEAVEDGVTGLVTAPRDPAAMANAIATLRGDPQRRLAFGEAGYQRCRQRFPATAMVDGYQEVYSQLLSNSQVLSGRAELVMHPKESAGAETTIFVTTIGDEANFSDCMKHLRAQTVQRPIEIIDHVAPMSAAFQCMHDRCATPYYVQVDEDMILFPHAIATLEELIRQAPPQAAMVCATLWDCDTEQTIYGVKIYRHAIVRQFPYEDTLSCEVHQIARMKAAGFTIELLSLGDRSLCLGEHGKHYTPASIFKRWQRMFHKHHQMGNNVWVVPWAQRLLDRYLETRELVHLYAFLGAVTGIAGDPLVDREADWREPNAALERLQRYFPIAQLSEPIAQSDGPIVQSAEPAPPSGLVVPASVSEVETR